MDLCGGKALAGFMDVDADIKVPRLECLGLHTEVAVHDLMKQLFVVSVPSYQEGPYMLCLRHAHHH